MGGFSPVSASRVGSVSRLLSLGGFSRGSFFVFFVRFRSGLVVVVCRRWPGRVVFWRWPLCPLLRCPPPGRFFWLAVLAPLVVGRWRLPGPGCRPCVGGSFVCLLASLAPFRRRAVAPRGGWLGGRFWRFALGRAAVCSVFVRCCACRGVCFRRRGRPLRAGLVWPPAACLPRCGRPPPAVWSVRGFRACGGGACLVWSVFAVRAPCPLAFRRRFLWRRFWLLAVAWPWGVASARIALFFLPCRLPRSAVCWFLRLLARGPWPAVWLALAPRPLWARFWPPPPPALPSAGGLAGGLASPCAAAWLAAPPLWSAPWRPLAPMRRLLAWWRRPARLACVRRRRGRRVALVRGRRWPWPPASVCLSSFFRLAGPGRPPGPALGRLAPGPAPGAGGLRPASLGFFSVAFFLACWVLLPWWAFFLPCCAWRVASVSTPLGRAPRG